MYPVFIVNADEMRHAEAAADKRGLSYDTMMENAGAAVAEAINQQFEAAGKQVTILVGPGNNGGDGLVAARYLTDLGAFVQIYLWKRRSLSEDLNWQRLQDYNLPWIHRDDDPQGETLSAWLHKSAIIVDSLLGTGASRPIEGDLANLLDQAREIIETRRLPDPVTLIDPIDPPSVEEIGPVVISVDLPSGLNTNTGHLDPHTLPADLTVTFAAPKYGHFTWPGPSYTGQLLIADIGIQPSDFPDNLPQLAVPDMIAALLPERLSQGHKGTFGRVLLAAGCLNFTGAPALSGKAAGRVGAGLVTVALPGDIHPIVAAGLTEATYLPLPGENGYIAPGAARELSQAMSNYKALLIGPGMGNVSQTTVFLQRFLSQTSEFPPLVLDADALNILANQKRWWELLPAQSILTPHPGEMSRLSGRPISDIEENRLTLVPKLARQWNQIIVYKGAFSLVVSPTGQTVVMPFANPALATAGSGDVLAGAILGVLGQGVAPFEAAIVGTYLHGMAGEIARERFGEAGVVAGDLPSLLPLAIRELAQ